MDFFGYISDFLDMIWNAVINFFEMVSYFYEMVFSALSLPALFTHGFFPPILGSMFLFVIIIAVIKIILTTGGYSE